VGAGFSTGWTGGCGSGNADFTYLAPSFGGTYVSGATTGLTPNGTGNQYFRFGIDWSGTIAQRTINIGSDVQLSAETEYTLNSTCTTSGAMFVNVPSVSNRYVFKTLDAGTNPTGRFIMFEVAGAVRTISSVTHPSGTVYRGETTTITATMSGALNTGQGVYLRYSNDNFSNSTIVEMNFSSGSDYVATIPASANSAGSTVYYYLFTSGDGMTITPANADLYTINADNNGGSNYQYTVSSSFASAAAGDWSNTASWPNATLPSSGSSVVVRHDLILDQDATVSSLTISAGTFTASDGSARTLTILRSAAGSATTITNSGGTWANGAGGSTVVFSGNPNAGDAIHSTSGVLAFQNATVNKTGGTSNVGVDFQTSSSVSGTLQIGTGGYVSTAPPASFYGGSAIIDFNQGISAVYDVNTTDFTWSTTVVPQNITVSSGTVNLNVNRTATGDLVVANSAALVLAAGIELEINSDFDLSGSITLNADASGYAQLKVGGAVSGSGTVTAEQYVSSAGWHNVSLPVGGVELSQLGTVGTDVHANTQNMYWYDAASETWMNVADGSVTNTAGRGYSAYFGTNGVAAAGSTVDITGSLNTSVTPTLSNAGDGWNLVGNPFSCALDFDAVTKTAVNNSYSVWNAGSSSYTSVSPVLPGSTKIAPFQAFWVQANAGSPSLGTLSMASHGTVSESPSYLKTQTIIADRLFVEVYEAANPAKRDQVLFGMIPGTSDGSDSQWDAGKRMNGAGVPSLMSKSQGVELAINAIDYSVNHTRTKKIPLRFVSTKAFEVYYIALEDSLLTNNYTVVLEDLMLNKKHDLSTRDYKFVHNPNAEHRFVLHLSPMSTINQGLTGQGIPQGGIGTNLNGGALVLKVADMDQASLMNLYDMSGKRVHTERLASGTYDQTISVEGLPRGIYVLELQGDAGYSHREKLYID